MEVSSELKTKQTLLKIIEYSCPSAESIIEHVDAV